MATIFITRKIPEVGIKLLEDAGHTVVISEKDDALTQEELIAELTKNEYDAVLCLLTDTIDGEVMDAAPTVKLYANYAVGFNNIDINVAKERGIVVTNTPGVLDEAVAEHTITLMFAIAKRIPEAFRFVKDGKFVGWAPMLFLTSQLKGSTLGLIGLGRIGSRVAELASCVGMHVIYYDIKRNTDAEEKLGITFSETIEDVLKQADVVSLHVPLLDSTRHLINKERLGLMKETTFLINTARGPVVDEKALVEALQNNVIAGAALDVFENEPQLTPGLAELPNVILTPHMASGTVNTRNAMSEMAAQNIIDFLEGKTPQNVVV